MLQPCAEHIDLQEDDTSLDRPDLDNFLDRQMGMGRGIYLRLLGLGWCSAGHSLASAVLAELAVAAPPTE